MKKYKRYYWVTGTTYVWNIESDLSRKGNVWLVRKEKINAREKAEDFLGKKIWHSRGSILFLWEFENEK